MAGDEALQPRQFPGVGKQPGRITTSGLQPTGLPLGRKVGHLFNPNLTGEGPRPTGPTHRSYTAASGERIAGNVAPSNPTEWEAPHSADYNAATGAGQGQLFSPDRPPQVPQPARTPPPRNVGMSSARLHPSAKTGRLFNPENLGPEMPPRTGRNYTTASGERHHQEYQEEEAPPEGGGVHPGQGRMFNAENPLAIREPSQPAGQPEQPGAQSLQKRQFHGLNPQKMTNEELVKWHRRSATVSSLGRVMQGNLGHAIAHASGQHFSTTHTVFRDELTRRARGEQMMARQAARKAK